jgi:hypothetical protein
MRSFCMFLCNKSWRNKEYDIPCQCVLKWAHEQETGPNAQIRCLCRCEMPGLFPEGIRIAYPVRNPT